NGNVALSEIQNVIATAANLLKEMNVDVDKMYVWNNVSDAVEVKIAGYLNMSSYWYCYLGADLYNQFYVKPPYYDNSSSSTKYEEPEDAYIGRILIPYDGSKSLIESLIKISETRNNDDSGAMIMNTIYSELNMIIDMASTLELGFIIAACVLALFAFLLMFNFISASITAKKKEIGILRAIGARTTDVFKIFVSEALIIAIICFAIATAGSFGLCILLNSILLEDVGLSISLFVFGPLSVLFILGVALLTALISTIIPVSIYSRKPPIDSIRAL
ncbi:MAG: FtsX-like permease family protein, partial [Clostridiales bacterium]|nr:FtsX-like permease family protein [Clostridiales bacterium]